MSGELADQSAAMNRAGLSPRVAAFVALLLMAAALGIRLLGAEQAATAALKSVSATLVVAIVPGALVTLLWRPRLELTILELVGFGIAVSFGIVQLLTMLAITAHVSAAIILATLMLGSALIAGRVIQRKPAATIVVSADEMIVASLLIVLGVFLYIQGSPFDSFEDQAHVAIARRLAYLPHPRLDNLYFAPDIVYTYPFPGTHYFIGLIARLGDIDALFLYHKLRFFWGPAALVMLYLAARAAFGSRPVATAVTVTAVVLVGSGVFAMVDGFPWGWAQLVPFSHASDVAMTVLLPALLVMAFGYLLARSTREQAFFFASSAMLVLMLTIVHIREIVQFAAYLGCFVVVTALFSELRQYLRRAVVLLVLTVTTAAVYSVWQSRTVTLVGDIVAEQRARLASIVEGSSFQTLVSTPAPVLLGDLVQSFDQVFGGLTPFFLFAAPAVILLFRRQPLVWLIASSTMTYLAVMSIPLLAIPYIYGTYYEILFTPVRNIIFFVYLFAGAFIYALVVALARMDRTRISPFVIGAVAGALALLATLCLNRSVPGFFLPLIAAYGLTFLFLRERTAKRPALTSKAVAGLVAVLALVALLPDHAPARPAARVNVRWTTGVSDVDRAALEQRFSLAGGQPTPDRTSDVNVWDYTLSDLSAENVAALVQHPDVVDTHHIDRSTFAVVPQSPPTDHPILGVERVAWLQYPDVSLLFATGVLIWALGLAVPVALATERGRAVSASVEAALREPFYRHALPFALFIIPFVLWSARPTLSPWGLAPVRPVGHVATPRALIDKMPCVTTRRMPVPFTEDILPGEDLLLPERTACAPDYEVIEWVRTHVPPDALFAIDGWNPYLPSVFMPQQVVAFPPVERSFVHEKELFKRYYELFDERVRKYRVQPFFNSIEAPAERTAFVERLGVTHVLVDPPYYDEMRTVLDALPQQFELQYSSGKWAVYDVL